MTKSTVLITGASSGIGYDLAEIFAKNGFNLILVSRSLDKLQELSTTLSQSYDIKVTVIPKDLSTLNSANELFSEVLKKGLSVDILINNAGFGMYGPFNENNSETLQEMMILNMITLTHLTRLFLPSMLKNKSGRILNVASIAAFQPGPNFAVYSATKSYVLSFTEAIAEELEDTGVSISVLCPGITKTQFMQRSEMKASALLNAMAMSSNRVAQLGYNGLMAGERVIVTGTANKMSINLPRFLPRRIVTKISKKILSAK
jgi:short-subunit dehydrogenase